MKSYLINLATRPDRLQQATEQLHAVGFEPERFEAFTEHQAGGNRPLAFNKSQYYCIKKAVEEGHEIFAIFEDDVMFTDGAKEKIEKAIEELPDHFALLHLGCNIIGMSTTEWEMPQPYDNHLAQIFNCWQSHAIIWSLHGAKLFLANFPYYTDDYAREGLMIYDEWLRQKFYPEMDCFVMRPMVAYQRPDFSDINQGHSDYTYCFNEGNKYLFNLSMGKA